MNKPKNKYKFILAITAILSIMGFGGYQLAFGNPTSFPIHSNCATASATTTFAWLSAGRGTTTITCDAYTVDPSVPSAFAINSGSLQLIIAASSTALTDLRYRVEHSNDLSVGWFAEASPSSVGEMAMTPNATTTQFIGTFAEQRLSGLSTSTTALAGSFQTVGFGAGNNNGSTTAIFLHIPLTNFSTRYTRVVLYVGGSLTGVSTSSNLALWGEIVPLRQMK